VKRSAQPAGLKENAGGSFCPEEDINRVEDLFLNRERDGRTIERQLGIRRSRFELALRELVNRYRGSDGPKAGRVIEIRRAA